MRRTTTAKLGERRAAEVLRNYGHQSTPVDVEAIARHLGAEVVFEEMDDDVSGFLLREGDATTIGVNKLHHVNRQRFTIAHECGHLALHAKQEDRLWIDRAFFLRDSNSSTGERLAEVQANQFAAALLMPADRIRAALRDESRVSDLDVLRLALRFGVSEQAMTLRLVSLGLLDAEAAGAS